MESIHLGDTFTLTPGGHLWIVLSDPDKNCGKFVIVNLTTDSRRAGIDCILDVGDHPWIREKSYISYGDAQIVTPEEKAKILKSIEAGVTTRDFPVDLDILKDIVDCGKKSRALAPIFKSLL